MSTTKDKKTEEHIASDKTGTMALVKVEPTTTTTSSTELVPHKPAYAASLEELAAKEVGKGDGESLPPLPTSATALPPEKPASPPEPEPTINLGEVDGPLAGSEASADSTDEENDVLTVEEAYHAMLEDKTGGRYIIARLEGTNRAFKVSNVTQAQLDGAIKGFDHRILDEKSVYVEIPAECASWKRSIKNVLTCAFQATKNFLQNNLGRNLDTDDEAWYKNHPDTEPGGLPKQHSLRVLNELVRPYGMGISEVWIKCWTQSYDEHTEWKNVLGCNNQATYDNGTMDHEYIETMASHGQTPEDQQKLRDLAASEVAKCKFHYTNQLPAGIPLVIMASGMGSQYTTGVTGGHASYIGPRAGNRSWEMAIAYAPLELCTRNQEPTSGDYEAEQTWVLDFFDCKTKNSDKKLRELCWTYNSNVNYGHKGGGGPTSAGGSPEALADYYRNPQHKGGFQPPIAHSPLGGTPSAYDADCFPLPEDCGFPQHAGRENVARMFDRIASQTQLDLRDDQDTFQFDPTQIKPELAKRYTAFCLRYSGKSAWLHPDTEHVVATELIEDFIQGLATAWLESGMETLLGCHEGSSMTFEQVMTETAFGADRDRALSTINTYLSEYIGAHTMAELFLLSAKLTGTMEDPTITHYIISVLAGVGHESEPYWDLSIEDIKRKRSPAEQSDAAEAAYDLAAINRMYDDGFFD